MINGIAMDLKAYEITSQGTLAGIPVESLSPDWRQDETQRWLDVEGGNPEVLRELLAPFDLHPLVMDACTAPGVAGHFTGYEKELYIEFSVLGEGRNPQLTRVSVICLPTTLLTIHHEPVPAMTALTDDLAGNRRLITSNTSGLLYHLFDYIVDRLALRAGPAKARAKAIAKALNEDPDSVEIGEVLNLKSRVGELVDELDAVLFCVSRLRMVKSKAFDPKELGVYLNDLAGALQNIQSTTQRFEASLSDLHQQYVLTQQDKMNSRLQILTVISAVFLPLTLLAGIYGMNFVNMPELQWTYGYLVVIGLMAVIVVAMLYVFYRRGWFK